MDEKCKCEKCTCKPLMCKTCGLITNVLFLLGGGALLAYGLMSTPGALDTHVGDPYILAAGVLFVLVAISNLVHVLGACPMCKS